MAFCNSCGATLNSGTQFCNKCGAPVAAGASASGVTSTVPPPAAPTGGSSALKVILIVVAVIVLVGILGVDLYPGAEVQRNGASSASFGGIRTVTAVFETSDAPDKVCGFYKSRFPGAMVTTSEQNHCTIVSNDKKNMVTINVEASGDNTRLQITNVTKKSD